MENQVAFGSVPEESRSQQRFDRTEYPIVFEQLGYHSDSERRRAARMGRQEPEKCRKSTNTFHILAGSLGRWLGYPAVNAGGAVGAMAGNGEENELVVTVHGGVDGFIRSCEHVIETAAFIVSNSHTRLLP